MLGSKVDHEARYKFVACKHIIAEHLKETFIHKTLQKGHQNDCDRDGSDVYLKGQQITKHETVIRKPISAS